VPAAIQSKQKKDVSWLISVQLVNAIRHLQSATLAVKMKNSQIPAMHLTLSCHYIL